MRRRRRPSALDDDCADIAIAPVGDGVRICSWNLRNFGTQATAARVAAIARFVLASCDLLVALEVRNGAGAIEEVHQRLSGWTIATSDTPLPRTSRRQESYTMLWRDSSARLCDGWAGVRNDPALESDFVRPPNFVCLELTAGDATSELMVAGYHATFSPTATLTQRAAIEAEIRHMPDVVAAMRTARGDADHFIVAGDWNVNPSRIAEILGPEVVASTLVGVSGSTINTAGVVSHNVYDHILAFDQSGDLRQPVIVDARECANDFGAVTDHLPAVAVLNVH